MTAIVGPSGGGFPPATAEWYLIETTPVGVTSGMIIVVLDFGTIYDTSSINFV
jgi:hypothetical protein